MPQAAPNVEEIFHAALELEGSGARSAFLDRACGDAELRRRVERLLAVDAKRGSDFLEAPASSPTVTAAHDSGPGVEEAGAALGPYKLLEPIGEGGMGTVYMAEQQEPVRRRVALKVIKPGLDSKQVIARFEAERQALAMMDHPNIARVLDGGMTPSGRPYFVMELVRGLPVTEYCDRHQLSIPQRLELFVLVCRAVQHAHQKGVIHRDLKPSNILVTDIDGVATPKVIDFGVAKAIGQALTEKTLFTGFHQFVGTPLYVSPEQAELSGADVDTRSDIYSLGVLLYELLTGTTPFDSETLGRAAFDEMRRIIREEEPPRPSTRLSSLGERLSTVSSRRKADPSRLGSSMKGELDWVVMKALEKDRRRRYETANDFAADVMRYLTDRPVEAHPPSSRYRFAKYARRHRAALTTAALVLVALAGGLAATTWQAVRATAAEKRAGAALAQADDHLGLARRAVDQFYEEAAARWMSDSRNGSLPKEILERALPFYERFAAARRVDPEVGRAHKRVGEILVQLERGAEAKQAFRRAEAIFQALRVVDPEDAGHLRDLADCYVMRSFPDGSAPPFEEAVALREQLAARPAAEPRDRRDLALIHVEKGLRLYWAKRPGAEENFRRALAIQERLCAEGPADPHARSDLGATLRAMGDHARDTHRLADAERFGRRALRVHESLVGRHPTRPQFLFQVAWDHTALSRSLVAAQRYDAVPECAGRAATIYRGLVNDYPNKPWFRRFLALALGDLAKAQFQAGRRVEAEQTIREIEGLGDALAADQLVWIAADLCWSNDPKFSHPAEAIALLERSLRLGPNESGWIELIRGASLYRLGDLDGAIRDLERAFALMKEDLGDGLGFWLAMAHHRKGDHERARALYDRSVAWMTAHDPHNRFLLQYRAEAGALLGVGPPDAGPPRESAPRTEDAPR